MKINEYKNQLDFQKNFLKLIKNEQKCSLLISSLSISETKNFSKTQRAQVYQNGYISRLSNSIRDDFPKTLKKIKDNSKVINDFIKKNNSHFTSLACYSSLFPNYIKLKFKQEKYLYDLALMEWYFNIACYSLELEVSNLNKKVNAKSFLNKKIKLSESLNLLKTSWSIHKSKIERSSNYLVIFRGKNGPEIKNISLQEFHIIEMIQKGKSILSILRQKKGFNETTINKVFFFLSENNLLRI